MCLCKSGWCWEGLKLVQLIIQEHFEKQTSRMYVLLLCFAHSVDTSIVAAEESDGAVQMGTRRAVWELQVDLCWSSSPTFDLWILKEKGGGDWCLQKYVPYWIGDLLQLGLLNFSYREANYTDWNRVAGNGTIQANLEIVSKTEESSKRDRISSNVCLAFILTSSIFIQDHSIFSEWKKVGIQETFLSVFEISRKLQRVSLTGKSQIIPYKPSITYPSSRLGLSFYIKCLLS